MPYLYRLGFPLPHSRYWWTGGKYRNKAPQLFLNVSLLNILKTVSWEIHLPCREAEGEECQDCWVDASTMCLFARGAAFSLTDTSSVRQLFSLLAGCLLTSYPRLLRGNLPHLHFPSWLVSHHLSLLHHCHTVHTLSPLPMEPKTCPLLLSPLTRDCTCLIPHRLPTQHLCHTKQGCANPLKHLNVSLNTWICSKLHPNPRNTIITKSIISSNVRNIVP